MLNTSDKVTLLCGRGCAGAHAELLQLAEALKAPVVHALGGKEHVEWDNPYDVGMTGLIGFSSGYRAMLECDTLLLLGTASLTASSTRRRPRSHRSICGREPRAPLPDRSRPDRDVGATITALLPRLRSKTDRTHLDDSLAHYRKARDGLDALAVGKPGGKIHPQYVARTLSEVGCGGRGLHLRRRHADDLGGTLPLTMNGRRRLIGSLNHGSMANALPQAIGAQAPIRGGRSYHFPATAIRHADGRPADPQPAQAAGEGRGAEQRHPRLRRNGDEGSRLPRDPAWR